MADKNARCRAVEKEKEINENLATHSRNNPAFIFTSAAGT
jgi:hypothetical protein